MQVTNDEPRKVVMARWEYMLTIPLVYFAGYANGRVGWAHMLHNLGWRTLELPFILLLAASLLCWMWLEPANRFD